MMKRPTHTKRGWLYCAATGLLLMGPAFVHAQTAGSNTAAAKSTRQYKKPNPLVIAVKRELGRFKVTKKQQPTPKIHSKSVVHPTYSEVASDRRTAQMRPQVIQTAGRRNATTRSKKPGLLDRLLGLDKPQNAARRVTADQNVPKTSNGVPGLLPGFLKPKQARSASRRPQPVPAQTASQPPALVLKDSKTPTMKLDELDNPFPEGTEAAADEDLTQIDIAPEPVQITSGDADDAKVETVNVELETPEENPFSGLTLEEPQQFEKPVVKSASGTVEADPFAEAEETPVKEETTVKKETVVKSETAPPLPLKEEAVETEEEPVVASEPEDSAPAKEAAEDDSTESKLQKLAAREDQSGFKGFCPVALRNQRDLIDVDPNISSTFEEKTYHFSTDEAKAKFDAEPTKYAPIHGGHDVIVLTEGDVELEGTLEYAVWFKDRLYLFSSAATLETFVSNPAKYAALAAGDTTDE